MEKISYIQSFRRYENKYLLTPEQAQAFLLAAEGKMIPDRYGEYTIRNLYLDTEDFYFIEHSLDKPVYKEKLRLRGYGAVNDSDHVFLEIKKKYRGVVYKRRIALPLKEAESYIYAGIRPQNIRGEHPEQIFEEIDYLMKRYEPYPRIYLAYDRQAYQVVGYPQLRITLDRNIRSRWKDMTLQTDEGTRMLDTGIGQYRLMEIKSDGALPCDLVAMLSELKIFPTSFSKYGRIYTNSLEAFREKERKYNE